MLKHRQDGLVFLHGLCLDFLIVILFIVQTEFCRLTGLSDFTVGPDWNIFLIGVVAAMIWNHHALPGVGARLGTFTFRDAGGLTRQQMCRLMAVLFAVGFATKDVGLSRGFVAAFIGLAGGLLLVANWLLPRHLASILFRTLQFRTVVFATAPDALRLQSWLAERRYLGQLIVGCVTPQSRPGRTGEGLASLGSMTQLRDILERHEVNQVIIDREKFTLEEISTIQEEAERSACRVRYFVDLSSVFGEEQAALECNEHYVFAGQDAEPLDNPVNSLAKRALDLAVALPVVCFVLPPLMVMVSIAHRLQSPGPLFYRQERSGLNRQRFHIFKFRTMHTGTAHLAACQAVRDDPRVFAFGRFLRKSSLDEFPQFINVLLGQMSVSGPRPHMVEHDRQFAGIVGSYYRRHFVKPGITGLAQSVGLRGEVVGHDLLRQRIDQDLRYVNMWSMQLDLKIIAATARQVLRPPGAAY